jgi:uncharacterized membrane protein
MAHLSDNCRGFLVRMVTGLLFVALLLPAPAFALDSEDSQIFITGFNAYQKKDYQAAIDNLSRLLKKYPDTPLKDMGLFWLARANYKAGRQQEAAKYMSQFLREYPDSPLKGTVEEGLLALAEKYQKGEAATSRGAAVGGEPVARKTATPAEKVPAERVVPESGAVETAAVEGAAADRAAADRAAADRAAADRAAADRAAADRAAADRAAADRAAEKAAAERAAGGKEVSRKAAEGKAVAQKREAIASFRQAKPSEPAVPRPVGEGTPPPAAKTEISQVFTLEVAQFADLQVNVGPAPEKQEVGQSFSIPIDIVNTGNGSDRFTLESGFPPEYDFHFAAASAPTVPLKTTPTLAAGETFNAVAIGTVPQTNIDGQKNSYPVRAVSSFSKDASKSRQISFVSAAPLLRAVVKTEKKKILPGERIIYRISIVNAGTATANRIFLKVTYAPEYEPERLPEGMKQEGKGVAVLDTLELKSGQSKDLTLLFLLKDDALADQEVFVRADLINRDLNKKESFLSPVSVVQKVSGVTAKTPSDRLVVIPGQVVSIPVVVTNTGNVRDTFGIKVKAPADATYDLYEDVNRDGKREPNEPLINYVGPLAPKEEAYVMLEVTTPASAKDSTVGRAALYVEPESAPEKMAAVNLHLAYSRPILNLTMAAKGGRVKPGEVASLELDCVNHGSNLAKQVTLQSILPAQLELVASDPAYSKSDDGIYTWRFEELGAGERRNIKVSYRVRPGIAVGTNMQVKHLLSYQDQLGNKY